MPRRILATLALAGVFTAAGITPAEATHTNRWWPCNVMPQLSYICHQ